MPTEAYPGERHMAYWTAKLRSPCFVYVIRAEGDTPIKVGVAKDVRTRMLELQTGNPRRLKLLYVIPGKQPLEWNLHRLIARSRLVGEWFDGPRVAPFLTFVAELAERMMKAHDLSGNAPDWRDFGEWSSPQKEAAPIKVKWGEPTPITEEEKQRRLRAWYQRPAGIRVNR